MIEIILRKLEIPLLWPKTNKHTNKLKNLEMLKCFFNN